MMPLLHALIVAFISIIILKIESIVVLKLDAYKYESTDNSEADISDIDTSDEDSNADKVPLNVSRSIPNEKWHIGFNH